MNHLDTAQFYGPDVANELIHAALYPYPEQLVLVSKVGAERDAQGCERRETPAAYYGGSSAHQGRRDSLAAA